MTHNQIEYLDIFRQRGLRNTRQRQVLLDVICCAGKHLTLNEIHTRTHQIDRSIDKSTVYRSLKLFLELGLVVLGEKINDEQTYEMVHLDRHHHLSCTDCGSKMSISNELVDNFYKVLAGAYGFQAEMDHMIVLGLCENCRKKHV